MKSFPITAFKLHRAQGFPVLEKLAQVTQAETNREELLSYYRTCRSPQHLVALLTSKEIFKYKNRIDVHGEASGSDL